MHAFDRSSFLGVLGLGALTVAGCSNPADQPNQNSLALATSPLNPPKQPEQFTEVVETIGAKVLSLKSVRLENGSVATEYKIEFDRPIEATKDTTVVFLVFDLKTSKFDGIERTLNPVEIKDGKLLPLTVRCLAPIALTDPIAFVLKRSDGKIEIRIDSFRFRFPAPNQTPNNTTA